MIDDDVGIGRVLQRSLRGHDVVTAASGREALELLATGATFDVILCDLVMPDLGGPDVHQALQKTRPELCERMIFMSGGAFTPVAEAFARTTTCTLVNKPFDMKAMRALVAERVARRAQ